MAVLTDADFETFRERGCVRLDGAFSPELASRFEADMWSELARDFAVDRSDPATWHLPPGRGLPGVKGHRLQPEIGSERLCGGIDDLLGRGAWQVPAQWGGVLVSLPGSDQAPWQLPAEVWHFDARLTTNVGVLRRVFVFTVFAPLAEHGGATLVLEGSHRLLMRFHEQLSKPHRNLKHKWHRERFMKWDPYLEMLATPGEPENRIGHFMGQTSTVKDVPVKVRELTGDPGDAWLCHPLLMHCRSPCTGTMPRFTMAKMIAPASGG